MTNTVNNLCQKENNYDFYEAPTYTMEQLQQLDENQVHFPFSDEDAVYNGVYHQYELTEKYFIERGRNLQLEVTGNAPDKVKHFLSYLRRKVYNKIYTTNKKHTQPNELYDSKKGTSWLWQI